MKKKRIIRIFKTLNISSIFFFITSCISVSFAWFAFTNSTTSNFDLDVSAWYVKIGEDNERTIHVDINNFFPGMNAYNKEFEIINEGDIDAKLEYNIKSLRIFNQEFVFNNNRDAINSLSHDYPFKLNFSKSSDIVSSKSNGKFSISITWPFNSNDNSQDTYWGEQAFIFQEEEEQKYNQDNTYLKKKDIELSIELVVSQNLDEDVSDNRFLPGKEIILNTLTSQLCKVQSTDCRPYYVLDANNLLQDSKVKLINVNNNSGNSELTIEDVLKLISKDIYNSYIEVSNADKSILGFIDSVNVNNIISSLNNNGIIYFSNDVFNYLDSNVCYYVKDSNLDNKYVIYKENNISILKLNNQNECKNASVLYIEKNNLIE